MHIIRKILRILVYVIIFSIFLVFAMLNNKYSVPVDYLFNTTPNMPVWVLIFISLIMGLIFGLLLTVGFVITANREKRHYQKEMKTIKNELNRMRNVSIEEDLEEEDVPPKTKRSVKKNDTEVT